MNCVEFNPRWATTILQKQAQALQPEPTSQGSLYGGVASGVSTTTEKIQSPHDASDEQCIGEFLEDTWGSMPAVCQQVRGSFGRNFSD